MKQKPVNSDSVLCFLFILQTASFSSGRFNGMIYSSKRPLSGPEKWQTINIWSIMLTATTQYLVSYSLIVIHFNFVFHKKSWRVCLIWTQTWKSSVSSNHAVYHPLYFLSFSLNVISMATGIALEIIFKTAYLFEGDWLKFKDVWFGEAGLVYV